MDWRKEFLATFRRLSSRQQPWRVWSDFVEMAACAISNSVDRSNYEPREKRYLEIARGYEQSELEQFPKLLACTVQALDQNPEQDFLGDLFQELELSNHWKGQFFTPYNLCKAMAEISADGLQDRIKEKGFVTVNDPACGAGALLIAFANVTRSRGVNFQRHVLFVAQDIDPTAAYMCYIQLSLLSCPGYVIVGDTLSRPGLHPENDVWYTPMWFVGGWPMRMMAEKIGKVIGQIEKRLPAPDIEPQQQEVVQLTLF